MRKLLAGLALMLMVSGVPVAAVGIAGADPPAPNPNQVEFWCPGGGVKFEPVSTPFTVPALPAGISSWTLLVLKAGNEETSVLLENELFANPVVGQAYVRSDAKNISHAILCYGPPVTTLPPTTQGDDPPTTTSTTTTTTTTTLPPTTQGDDPPTTTTTTTTIPPTTTSSSTTTSCPDCSPTQQTAPTTVGTTTTAAPCLNCRSVETTPTTTPGTVATTVPPTTAPPTTAPSRALPVTSADQFATTAPAPLEQLPVTGSSNLLGPIGLFMVGLGTAMYWATRRKVA